MRSLHDLVLLYHRLCNFSGRLMEIYYGPVCESYTGVVIL